MTHDDQKLRTIFLKANKTRLAAICCEIFSIKPNKASRLLKRTRGAVIAAVFCLRFRIVAVVEEAEKLAVLALGGDPVPDDAESE